MPYEAEIDIEGDVYTIIIDDTTSDGEGNE